MSCKSRDISVQLTESFHNPPPHLKKPSKGDNNLNIYISCNTLNTHNSPEGNTGLCVNHLQCYKHSSACGSGHCFHSLCKKQSRTAEIKSH